MSVRFKWDNTKAVSNLKKHSISFKEAKTVFCDPLARIFDDKEHSIEEKREIIIGHSTNSRLLLVCFTEQINAVRIFSARLATRKEQKDYEENANF